MCPSPNSTPTRAKPLEAVYVFPGSTRAAVYGMRHDRGRAHDRGARSAKGSEARAEYEQAKPEGRTASLLEQQRPNVFQMNVANIMPGDDDPGRAATTPSCWCPSGVYEFVYPTVVGPRYSNRPRRTRRQGPVGRRIPTCTQGEAAHTLRHRRTCRPACPSGSSTARRTRSRSPTAADRSPTCDWTASSARRQPGLHPAVPAGPATRSNRGLLLFRGDKENFFLLMVQPPGARGAKADPAAGVHLHRGRVRARCTASPSRPRKELLGDLIGGLRAGRTGSTCCCSPATRRSWPSESLPGDARQHRAGRPAHRPRSGAAAAPSSCRRWSEPWRCPATKTSPAPSSSPPTATSTSRRGLRADPHQPGRRQPVRLRHRLLRSTATSSRGWPGPAWASRSSSRKPDEGRRRRPRFPAHGRAPGAHPVAVAFNGFEAYDVEPPRCPTCSPSGRCWSSASGAGRRRAVLPSAGSRVWGKIRRDNPRGEGETLAGQCGFWQLSGFATGLRRSLGAPTGCGQATSASRK